MSRETLFVSATPGLEGPLGEELEQLGFPGEVRSGGVALSAPAGSFRTINLWSRLAGRVLLQVGEVSSPEALSRLSLAQFGKAFEIDAYGEGALRWRAGLPSTPGAPQLILRGARGRCEVNIDTSGEPLHFRGYRQEVGRAPMRETLAAGVLQLAKWRPGERLWDPMCGSGTLLIEAAELAAGLAPGRRRAFAFESFANHDQAAWEALPRSRAAVETALNGSDLNSGALGTARRNARRAGVLDRLVLERMDATQLTPKGPHGLMIANLPYGKRVNEGDDLARLYRAFGAALRRACPGWYFAFLLQSGAEHLGLHVAERHAVGNGGLECEVVLGQIE